MHFVVLEVCLKISLKIARDEPSKMAAECGPRRKPGGRRMKNDQSPDGVTEDLALVSIASVLCRPLQGLTEFHYVRTPGLSPGLYSAACSAGLVNGSL